MSSKSADRTGLDLSLGEWAVLGLLVRAPAHGFALAKELKADGSWGQIWTVSRPLVYRALIALEAMSLIGMDRAEESRLGPRRAVYQATPAGKAAFSRWLNRPAEHYRDIRSELILKLGFLWMRGESADSLLSAQLAVIVPMLDGLGMKLSNADGFDRTLALWRFESAQTLVRFVERLRNDGQPARPKA